MQGRPMGARAGGLVLATLVTTLAGCQGLQDMLPTKQSEPTPSPTPAAPALSIPVVVPATPAPVLGGPAPSPTPTTNPAPAPTPGAPPTGGSCSLPPSNSPDAPCSMGSPSFLSQVDKAITQVTQQQPSLFNFNNNLCQNCYYVKDQDQFVAAVIQNLSAMGLCAYYDGEELAVKNSNSFNDQFDILVSSGHIRRGDGSYRATCTPSWF
jgi:hypothetical protein